MIETFDVPEVLKLIKERFDGIENDTRFSRKKPPTQALAALRYKGPAKLRSQSSKLSVHSKPTSNPSETGTQSPPRTTRSSHMWYM